MARSWRPLTRQAAEWVDVRPTPTDPRTVGTRNRRRGLPRSPIVGRRPGPSGLWAVARAVSTPHCLRGTRQDLSCTSAGEPRTPVTNL